MFDSKIKRNNYDIYVILNVYSTSLKQFKIEQLLLLFFVSLNCI
jgi:hypothetical protein